MTNEHIEQRVRAALDMPFIVDAMTGSVRKVSDFVDVTKLVARMLPLIEAVRAAEVKAAAMAACYYCRNPKGGYFTYAPTNEQGRHPCLKPDGDKVGWDYECGAVAILARLSPDSQLALEGEIERAVNAVQLKLVNTQSFARECQQAARALQETLELIAAKDCKPCSGLARAALRPQTGAEEGKL